MELMFLNGSTITHWYCCDKKCHFATIIAQKQVKLPTVLNQEKTLA